MKMIKVIYFTTIISLILLVSGCSKVESTVTELLKTDFEKYFSCKENWNGITGSQTSEKLCFNEHSIANNRQITINGTARLSTFSNGKSFTLNIENNNNAYIAIDNILVILTNPQLSTERHTYNCAFKVIEPLFQDEIYCNIDIEMDILSERFDSDEWDWTWRIGNFRSISITSADL